MKLKGEENYNSWRAAIENIAKSNGLRRYIHKKGKAPKEVDEFDDDVDPEELQKWLD
jgi:hypothetical protein